MPNDNSTYSSVISDIVGSYTDKAMPMPMAVGGTTEQSSPVVNPQVSQVNTLFESPSTMPVEPQYQPPSTGSYLSQVMAKRSNKNMATLPVNLQSMITGDTPSYIPMAAGGTPPVMQEGNTPAGLPSQNATPAPVVVGDGTPATEAETVADNIPADVPEGTFVLNAPAVEFAGSDDIKKMLLDAMEEAKRQGIDITQNNTKMSKENLVSLVVSKKEVLIPPVLAEIIGYDRLEKINNRGKQEVEKRIAENGQDIPPEAQQTASDGGTQNSVADTEVIDVYRSIVAQGGDAGRFQVFEKAFREYQKGKAYRPMHSEIGTPEFDEEVRSKYGYAFPETEGGMFATKDRDAPLAKTKKKVSKPDSGEGFVPAP